MNIYNTAMRKSTTLAAATYFARESVDEPFIDDEGYAQTLKDVIEIYGGVPAHIAHRLADVLDRLPRNKESALDDAAWALDILVQTRSTLNELLEIDRTLMASAQEDKPLTEREKENIRREAAKFDADYLETTDEKNAEFRKGGDAYDHDGLDNEGTRASFYGVKDVNAHENAIRANADNQSEEREFLEVHDVFTKPTDVAENKKPDTHESPNQPDITCSESKDTASTKDVPPVVKTQSHEKTAESASAENASSEKSADEKDTPEKPIKATVPCTEKRSKSKCPNWRQSRRVKHSKPR
jgi:chemotaxis protein histidine kinase CheA